MKKFLVHSVVAFALVFAVSVPILADTIRLKDGSVIRGQIVSFKNEQFTILVGSGARGRKSRITVYMEDVDSIDFDASGNTSGVSTSLPTAGESADESAAVSTASESAIEPAQLSATADQHIRQRTCPCSNSNQCPRAR